MSMKKSDPRWVGQGYDNLKQNMTEQFKLLDLKQFVRNMLPTAAATHKIGQVQTTGLETIEEEMFIGSTFSSDLRDLKKKHGPEGVDALQKRIGIGAMSTKECGESIKLDSK